MSDFNTWLASYNGDHQRAAKDAFGAMQAYVDGHRRMSEERDALSAELAEARRQLAMMRGA